VLRIRDLGSGAFFDPWIRDGEKIRIRIWDYDHDNISENLGTICWVKIHNFFDADPGWKKFRSGIRDEKNSDPG
jgi:hypothetical protein